MYWGAPLSLAEATALPTATPNLISSFETLPAPDELAVEAGPRFGPPSLAAALSRRHRRRRMDATSATRSTATTSRSGSPTGTTRSTVTLHYRVYEDTAT